MSWTLIFTLAGIVFINRYVFLEPRVPVRMPRLVHEALQYSAPCLLTAICGPIMLMENETIRSFPDNPYLWGGILSVIISLFIKNMIFAVSISLFTFYLLVLFL
ncbi:AzlD domain-containing protein [Zobellella sp. DQSA1]|uniref:AzlD domain-containing protein n=1 Tax=Zobellella sp. DQSA1 TaxID=3342386 RepID=UPI0035C01AE4